MFSVMYTGMNFLPLCTASVCPMNSGRMVDRRDQVRTTFFSFFSFMANTFTVKWSSVKGPFFRDLPIVSALSLLRLAAHYVLVGALVIARFEASRRLTPRSHRMASSGSLAFAAAMRMVHWIHGYAAVMRTAAQPARLAGLAVALILVLDVAHLSDGGHTVYRHPPDFTRRQFQQGDPAFLGNQLALRSSRPRHLGALPGFQLNDVEHRAGWNILQRKRIAHQNVGFGT